ncbi:hypothetical protein [Mycobacterium adipatum]|jgi:hypothetical protein|uniref:hypothetical protein n=1 Tax=Mycobacterium adipatum TaxID=1682113 RepID=UPI000A98BCAF|nr:hypothetical protein [Mycobacterium adipatum]
MQAIDAGPASTRCRLRLHPTVFAPRISRRLVHELGDPADLPQRVVDDAAFVVGELVAESIRRRHHDVEVDIELMAGQIAVRVFDAQARTPLFDDRTDTRPARCSTAVRHLAASWGCDRFQHGWEVWAVLRSPPSRSTRTAIGGGH